MNESSVEYAEFVVTRKLKAKASDVYKMFADKDSKELWFKGPPGPSPEHNMDFRVGGTEFNEGKFHDGVIHTFKGTYYDIVPNERIIYTYEMYLDGKRISVSLATIVFKEESGETTLILHESGVFLDGLDSAATREQGSNFLMDTLVGLVTGE